MTVTTVLALDNRYDPICVALPKVAEASTIVTVACHCHKHLHLKNTANGRGSAVNRALVGSTYPG
jgi:hypothetical protein